MADKVDLRTGELVTTNYGWTKPTVGASTDAWGAYINTDLDGIDSTVHSISTSVPAASSTTPAMDGAATAGAGTTWARADHVHPSDTSRLPLAGGTLTGALTPSQTAGIVGTTTNNNASAGAVGECIIFDKLTNVPLSSNVVTNVTSISLTAGDWDVDGVVNFTFSTGAQGALSGISTVSATFPPTTYAGSGGLVLNGANQYINTINAATSMYRVSIATTTSVYLVAQGLFGAGTCQAQGTIMARRVR